MKNIEFDIGLNGWKEAFEYEQRKQIEKLMPLINKNLATLKRIEAEQKRKKEEKRKAEEAKQQAIAVAKAKAIGNAQEKAITEAQVKQTTTPQTTIIKAGKETTPPRKSKGFLQNENMPLIIGGVAVAVLGVFLITGGKKKNNSKKVKV